MMQCPGDEALTRAEDLVVGVTGHWADGLAVPGHSGIISCFIDSRPPALPDVAGTTFGSL